MKHNHELLVMEKAMDSRDGEGDSNDGDDDEDHS